VSDYSVIGGALDLIEQGRSLDDACEATGCTPAQRHAIVMCIKGSLLDLAELLSVDPLGETQ
jgi:hypothetical protein